MTASPQMELALRHHRAGRRAPAAEAARHHAAEDPEDPRAPHLLGTIAFEGGDSRAALDAFRKAVVLSPAYAAFLRDIAVAQRGNGESGAALRSVRRALRVTPSDASLFLLAGHLGSPGEAKEAYRKSVILRPDDPRASMNLANRLQLDGNFDAAEKLYRAAIRLNPNSAEAHKNMAVAMSERGSLDEAEAAIRRAVRHQPGEAAWRMALGQILLLRGRYEEGWKHYEWRWRAGITRPRGFPQKEWAGEDLQGGVLLIHAEQGLGDTLQFCRYAALAAERAGAEVVLEVQPQLKPLLSGLAGVGRVVAVGGEPLPAFDRHIPLMSLPRVFRTTLETIPAHGPYLQAEPKRRACWHERLAARPGLNVGLVWAGGVVTPRNPQRSIAPAKLAPLAGVSGVNFISLQKYHPGADRTPPSEALGLIDWTAELEDFGDTAALVDALDLVVAVDTAVAHLAGALGKPVWLLNRFFPCWRWMSEGEGSSWYPTLRQFRQPRLDDWDSVIATVRAALELHVTGFIKSARYA